MRTRTSWAVLLQLDLDRAVGRTRVDGVLDQVCEQLLDPRRIAIDESRLQRCMEDQGGMLTPLGRDHFPQQRLQVDDTVDLPAGRHHAARAEPASRSFFPPSFARWQPCLPRNAGLSAWRSAFPRDKAELADQVLDIVHDESEAAVKFIELTCFVERPPAWMPRQYSSPPGAQACATGRNLPN